MAKENSASSTPVLTESGGNKSTKPFFIDRESLEDAKKSLLDYYTSILSSQATRLIGFAAALFVLLQAVQSSKASPLSEIFAVRITINLAIPSIVEFSALFLSVFALLLFMIRTIFRYAAFAKICNGIMMCPQSMEELEDKGKSDEVRQAYEKETISSEGVIQYRIIDGMNRRREKVYGVPCSWFIAQGDFKQTNIWGWGLCALLSFISTCLLLLILW